ncbi:O-methyltransferase [Kitasatospora phosalacinea]|uniref:O-methyltransferase n=1 Tax=Kitasatospora phosalacinea TaxID=2065 RepID=A0A9W6UPD7_9ACTN|nr:class I SAM-dependent methyltransferase [Kitasatospora phosalacinea]GLW55047.1 hypothetical protein Kpho01_30580 [Kitasatospora phosalacinea]
MDELVAIVESAAERSRAHGFAYSCEPPAGELLAVLSAAVPRGGRILELGTGVGVGLAWIVRGLGGRDDVEVHSVDNDAAVAELAGAGNWPAGVRLHLGDAEQLLGELGQFDLIFADAPGGKWTGLDRTIAALRPGGVLIVDDLDPARYAEPEHVAKVAEIKATLLGHPDLVAVELAVGSGFVLATKR